MTLKYGTLHKRQSLSEPKRPETVNTEDYMYEDDKEATEHINWSQSNHEEELQL